VFSVTTPINGVNAPAPGAVKRSGLIKKESGTITFVTGITAMAKFKIGDTITTGNPPRRGVILSILYAYGRVVYLVKFEYTTSQIEEKDIEVIDG
jgi:hypothetical protein